MLQNLICPTIEDKRGRAVEEMCALETPPEHLRGVWRWEWTLGTSEGPSPLSRTEVMEGWTGQVGGEQRAGGIIVEKGLPQISDGRGQI